MKISAAAHIFSLIMVLVLQLIAVVWPVDTNLIDLFTILFIGIGMGISVSMIGFRVETKMINTKRISKIFPAANCRSKE